jgi:hypothetical protein
LVFGTTTPRGQSLAAGNDVDGETRAAAPAVLPASHNDDRIRWSTFYQIYTDDSLSCYAGAMSARYEALSFAQVPGNATVRNDLIHIVVNQGLTMLLGVVDSERDKSLAGVRAREVPGVFSVENDLAVDRKQLSNLDQRVQTLQPVLVESANGPGKRSLQDSAVDYRHANAVFRYKRRLPSRLVFRSPRAL